MGCGQSSNSRKISKIPSAIERGNIKEATYLLEATEDINQQDEHGHSYLHLAAYHGQIELVKHLIREGANVNLNSHSGQTPIMLAAKHKHDNAKVILALANAGAYLEEHDTSDTRSTALTLAAEFSQVMTLKALLLAGARNDRCNGCGNNALHIAAYYGKEDIVSCLLASGLDVNSKGRRDETAIMKALKARDPNKNVITALEEAGADILDQTRVEISHLFYRVNEMGLHIAAIDGDVEKAAILLQSGANVNARLWLGRTPLMLAAKMDRNNSEMVKLLIKEGAMKDEVDRSKGELTAFLLASAFGHAETAKVLIDMGCDANICTLDGNSPLHLAANNRNADMIKLLLNNQMNPNIRNNAGSTPLMSAAECRQDNSEVIKLLVKAGADRDVAHPHGGLTAMLQASYYSETGTLDALLDAGCDINTHDNIGRSALHWAAFGGKAQNVSLLLQTGLDVNATADDRKTPLIYAASCHLANSQVVKILVQAGANKEHAATLDATSAAYAVWYGKLETLKTLKGVGCDFDARLSNGETLLHSAAVYGRDDMIPYLLRKGLEINSRADNGRTPLMCAAMREEPNSRVVELLVAAGAEKDLVETTNSKTSAFTLSCCGNLETVKSLGRLGCDKNICTSEGSNALHVAAVHGHVDIVAFLIDEGFDVNAQNENGNSPLMSTCL